MAWIMGDIPTPTVRDEKELWAVCPKCKAHFPRDEHPKGLAVCPSCGAPARMGCRERVALIADPGTFVEIGAEIGITDHLGFADASGPYTAKAAATTAKTGLSESVLAGTCLLKGRRVALCVMDFRFFGGSLGSGTGDRIAKAAKTARAERIPLIIFCASGGARMQEGIVSLMQMAKTCAAIEAMRAEGIPYITVLTDPTTGGVSASYALIADIVVAEPRALIGFAGRRVIENTIRQKLPDDFQTAEYLLAHGFVDAIVRRDEMRDFLADTLAYHKPQTVAIHGTGRRADVRRAPAAGKAWDKVRIARAPGRPTIRDYIAGAFDSFTELHGDRLCGDDRALIGGLASIGGARVMLIGHRKGATAEENAACNFGMANPEGYRKALRLMRLAESWGLPVVTLVDTAGAFPGLEAEARGQAEAIGRNLAAMARLATPIVSVVTGEGGSGGAIGIAEGDIVLMLENAIYSVISPEGCAAILWKDGKFAPQAAEALKITAGDLLRLGVIDGIVPEPRGGAQEDKDAAAANLRAAILDALSRLSGIPAGELVSRRLSKYMAIGHKLD
ncbi:MAG: acetyl-CoA carboxylase carboxyltransferase subunit alpha [Kiritimatiellae bacterium]|nr:acetyl-CoA carboxylase carboxyltransferase subunit alpha [Kiritimatiellia bacterium]